MKKNLPKAEDLAARPYPMNVFQDSESGDWVAEVTDLPGCVGVGDSRAEAASVAEGFIRDWIDEAVSQSWDIPEPTPRVEASGRFVVRLPKSLHAWLQVRAEVEATSLNQLVVALLSERGTRRETLELVQNALSSLKAPAHGCPIVEGLAEWITAGATFAMGTVKGNVLREWRFFSGTEAPGALYLLPEWAPTKPGKAASGTPGQAMHQ
jgi:antitoxin HicB